MKTLQKTSLAVFISAIILSLFSFVAADSADNIVGEWFTTDKKAKVKIYKAKNEKYYGKIIWLKEPNDENGKPKVDKENPDESKRNEPIVGSLILHGFEYEGDNQWEEGEIYDPESGNLYSCNIELQKDGKLKVRGYIGFSLIGRTEYWTPAE